MKTTVFQDIWKERKWAFELARREEAHRESGLQVLGSFENLTACKAAEQELGGC